MLLGTAQLKYIGRVVMFLCLIAMVFVLSNALKDARGKYASLYDISTRPHAGDYLPTVSVLNLTGGTVVIGDPKEDQLQVVYFFNTACPYCLRSLPEVSRLAQWIKESGRLTFLGVSLDSAPATMEYVDSNNVPFPVFTFADHRGPSLLRARAVPMLVAIASDGKVVWSRSGAVLDGAARDSLGQAVRSFVNINDKEDK